MIDMYGEDIKETDIWVALGQRPNGKMYIAAAARTQDGLRAKAKQALLGGNPDDPDPIIVVPTAAVSQYDDVWIRIGNNNDH